MRTLLPCKSMLLGLVVWTNESLETRGKTVSPTKSKDLGAFGACQIRPASAGLPMKAKAERELMS